jgi:plasmid stability protein
MPDILVRGLEPETIRQLKARAKRNGRSLQGEAKRLLEQASAAGGEDVRAIFARCKRRLAGRKFSSSVPLIREDRNR